MPQPLSHPDLRRRNLSLLLGTLLRSGASTRKQVEQASGLSKATVSRLVDDLLVTGALVSSTIAPAAPSTRGRPAETLSVPASLGAVAGLSLGIHTTSIFVTDLSGRELSWRQLPTLKWESFEEAVDWAAGVASREVTELGTSLRRLVVAIPARAVNGTDITRAPLFMSNIEGLEFTGALSWRLECPVRIELDAAMVLAGLETLGFVDRELHPVLLNVGSVLTMSRRRHDGTIAGGTTASFGDFDLIPIETCLGHSRVGTLLGAHGLFEASERLSHPLVSMDDLWKGEGGSVPRLRHAFLEALTQAIRIIVVMNDPSMIIFTGRLSPLVRLCLDEVTATLSQELDQPPALQVIGHAENDYPAAVGAAGEACTQAVSELLARITRDGLTAIG